MYPALDKCWLLLIKWHHYHDCIEVYYKAFHFVALQSKCPAYLTNVNELISSYLQRTANLSVDKELVIEIIKGVNRFIVESRLETRFHSPLPSLILSSFVLLYPFASELSSCEGCVILDGSGCPFVLTLYYYYFNAFIFILWNGDRSAYIAFKGFSSIGWLKDAELLETGNWDFAYISPQGRRNSD